MTALLDRVKETTATTGTGTVTLSGTAVALYQTWASGGAVNGNQYSYLIEQGNDSEWGVGTFTSSGTTFSRDTVTGSIVGGVPGTSKINLNGTATVACAERAEDLPSVLMAVASGSANSLTISNIPQFGSTLEIDVWGRSAAAVLSDGIWFQMNGLSTSIYSYNRGYIQAGAAGGDQLLATTQWGGLSGGTLGLIGLPGTTAQANQSAHIRLRFPGYTSTLFRKDGDFIGSQPNSTSTDNAFVIYGVISAQSLSPITSIKGQLINGNMVAGTTMVARVLP